MWLLLRTGCSNCSASCWGWYPAEPLCLSFSASDAGLACLYYQVLATPKFWFLIYPQYWTFVMLLWSSIFVSSPPLIRVSWALVWVARLCRCRGRPWPRILPRQLWRVTRLRVTWTRPGIFASWRAQCHASHVTQAGAWHWAHVTGAEAQGTRGHYHWPRDSHFSWPRDTESLWPHCRHLVIMGKVKM